MADFKEVIFALSRAGIARDIVIFLRIEEGIDTAGQHFVDIGLMAHVEDYMVFRRIEHIVECYRGLDYAEIRRVRREPIVSSSVLHGVPH